MMKRPSVAMLLFAMATSTAAHSSSQSEIKAVTKNIEHVNPKNMHANPAFSQAVRVKSGSDLLFIGGQNAVDAAGAVVSQGDVSGQTVRAINNLKTVLNSQGLELANVVRWNVYVVQGQTVKDAYAAFQKSFDKGSKPPAITVTVVSGLANPDFLVEIDAVAAY